MTTETPADPPAAPPLPAPGAAWRSAARRSNGPLVMLCVAAAALVINAAHTMLIGDDVVTQTMCCCFAAIGVALLVVMTRLNRAVAAVKPVDLTGRGLAVVSRGWTPYAHVGGRWRSELGDAKTRTAVPLPPGWASAQAAAAAPGVLDAVVWLGYDPARHTAASAQAAYRRLVSGDAEHSTTVALLGPIKAWWDEWGSPRHRAYTAWRDAVRKKLVAAGYLVYSPHRAWQGAWDEAAQIVNDTAITLTDVSINLTPDGVPSTGTDDEMKLVADLGKPLIFAPPPAVTKAGLVKLLGELDQIRSEIADQSPRAFLTTLTDYQDAT